MTEVLAVALTHGFDEMDLHRIEALVHVENESSSALLKKVGFRLERTLRDRHFAGGKHHDHHLYARLGSSPAKH